VEDGAEKRKAWIAKARRARRSAPRRELFASFVTLRGFAIQTPSRCSAESR
jgi:hypothetical protein